MGCKLWLDFQDFSEGLLGDGDGAELLHLLLPLLLLVEEFAVAGHITAVELGGHIFAERFHRGPGDNLAADRGLDGYFY